MMAFYAQGIAPFGRDIAVLAPPAVQSAEATQEAALQQQEQPAAAGPEVRFLDIPRSPAQYNCGALPQALPELSFAARLMTP